MGKPARTVAVSNSAQKILLAARATPWLQEVLPSDARFPFDGSVPLGELCEKLARNGAGPSPECLGLLKRVLRASASTFSEDVTAVAHALRRARPRSRATRFVDLFRRRWPRPLV
jgi:hypothetical protein